MKNDSTESAAQAPSLSLSGKTPSILEFSLVKRHTRPRLTVSPSAKDNVMLAEKYNLSADAQLDIKKRVLEDLVNFVMDK